MFNIGAKVSSMSELQFTEKQEVTFFKREEPRMETTGIRSYLCWYNMFSLSEIAGGSGQMEFS